MPLSGTTTTLKPGPQKVARRGAALNSILDQLDQEWETLKQDSVDIHGLEESGLLAHYHSNVRGLLQDIRDPYGRVWPDEYRQGSRIPGMCDWLKGLQDQDTQAVKAAREQMVAALRHAWGPYQEVNPIEVPNGSSLRDHEVAPYTWEALVTHWPGDITPQDTETYPHFSCQAVADFNLAALALLFLNRQLRYYLTDLQPHADVDGRN